MRQFRDSGYYVTSDGNVIGKKGIIGGSASKDGYVRTRLSGKGNRKTYLIHRIVAECYVPNPNNYDTVNHINGVKTDNRPSNLEWCTQKDNVRHAFKMGLENHRKLTMEQADYIRKVYTPYHKEFGATPLSKKYGIHHGTIVKVAQNKTYHF